MTANSLARIRRDKSLKNKSVEGLRGLAALNVVASHFIAAFLPTMLHNNYPSIFAERLQPNSTYKLATSPFVSIFYNGHFAVLIFFVLSGYVLTAPFYNGAANSATQLKKRLLGRYLRLNIPIAAVVILSFILYKAGLYFNIEAEKISRSINWLDVWFSKDISFFEAAKEALYRSVVFGSGYLVPPTWTLRVEFTGSIYILLYYILKPKAHTLASVAFTFVLIYGIHRQDTIFYAAMFAGSILNMSEKFKDYRLVFFVFGVYFGGFQYESIFYNYLPHFNALKFCIADSKTFYNALGACLITMSVVQGFGRRFFGGQMCQFLGRISFSIYLIHFLVLCSLTSFLYIVLPQNSLILSLNLAVYLGVCIICAIIFERYIDRWAISLSRNFSSRFFHL